MLVHGKVTLLQLLNKSNYLLFTNAQLKLEISKNYIEVQCLDCAQYHVANAVWIENTGD